jgi:gag-polyprotein putative aspartyl protease
MCNSTTTQPIIGGSYITLKIQNNRIRSIIDTGSHFSLIAHSVANRLRLKVEPLNDQTYQTLFSANGHRLRLLGTADTVLEMSNSRIPHTIYVCENLHEQLLLGRSFLSDAGAIINFRTQTILFSETLNVGLHHSKTKSNFVRAQEQICVPPKSEVIFNVSCHSKFEQQCDACDFPNRLASVLLERVLTN